MIVADSIISRNIANWIGANFWDGGGIHNSGALTVINSTISENSAYYGGGICSWSSWDRGSTVLVIDSTISENCASTTGGGIYNGTTSSTTVIDSTISGNSATDGGGIYNEGPATFADCIISGNIASGYGGGIYNIELSDCYNSGAVTIDDSIVSGNNATLGGGIYWENLRPFMDPATVITYNSDPQIYPY
jgi:hypothetical protein